MHPYTGTRGMELRESKVPTAWATPRAGSQQHVKSCGCVTAGFKDGVRNVIWNSICIPSAQQHVLDTRTFLRVSDCQSPWPMGPAHATGPLCSRYSMAVQFCAHCASVNICLMYKPPDAFELCKPSVALQPSCNDGISLVRLCAVGWARFEPNRRRGSIWRHEDGRAAKHVGTVSCVPLLANVALFSMAELKDAKFRLRSLSTSTLASPNSEAKFQLQIRDSHPEAASELSGMWTLCCRHAFSLGQSPTISTSRRLFGLRHCFRL